jgi:hypothetical protein
LYVDNGFKRHLISITKKKGMEGLQQIHSNDVDLRENPVERNQCVLVIMVEDLSISIAKIYLTDQSLKWHS